MLNVRMNEERFRLLVDSLPELVWMSDTGRRCIYFNRQWLAFTGRSLEQALARGWTDAVHPDDYARCGERYATAFAGCEAFTVECRLRRSDGAYRWVLNTGVPCFAPAGEFLGFVGSAIDITERKLAEDERERLQRQLQQAQKMEAIGQLTGGIAHDFNNILASIIGYTGLALTRFVPDRQSKLAEYLREVYHAGERARDLIAQMLTFSRGAIGEPKPYQLEPLVKEAVKLLQSTLPSSIELRVRVDEQVPAAVMDPVQLHQIVINLCINARDAMHGHGRIDIGLRHVRDVNLECSSCHGQARGEFVELAVEDTGSGIEPEVMVRMFDPFFSTKEPGRGSGMGLSMVHGIVHDHGGHILVESSAGRGSLFRLLFPVIQRPSATVSSDWPAETPGARGQGEGRRILVVDDEESVARFVGELLDSRGYQVTVMTESAAVMDCFRDDPGAFDLVVTDQTMPDMTGIELAQALLELRPDLPIILCTGYSEEVDESRVKALGIRGYLTKPLTINVLMERVGALLA